MPFREDRSWTFPVGVAQLWTVLDDTGAYRRWWPWLRHLDEVPLRAGERARATIRPPLPYSVSVAVELVDVTPAALVAARVTGDLAGTARLHLAGHPDGSRARLTWELEPDRALLRVLQRVGRPVLSWGHDWVLDRAVAEFRRVLADRTPEAPATRPTSPASPTPAAAPAAQRVSRPTGPA